MRALLAICRQTIRTSVRQRVFHLLLVLVLLTIFLLPLSVAGDGTAAGEMQITLSYTLGIITALISAATLWIACSSISREVEGYQMHLVLSTSTPRWVAWVGKWLGIFLLQAVLFGIGAAVIFGMVRWKVAHWQYPPEETVRVKEEVLVGRRELFPEQPRFRDVVEDEYRRRLSAGLLDPAHNPAVVKGELLRQLKARSTEVAPGDTRFWRFPGIMVPAPGASLHLRYRLYAGSTSRSDQRFAEGLWVFKDPQGGPDSFSVLPQRVMSGGFHEITVPAALVAADGTLVVAYANQGTGGNSIIFQTADGPSLLVPATGFLANYLRAMLLVLLQLAVLTAIGCTVSALFSSPVALFVAVAYLVIGFSVQSALGVPVQDELEGYKYRSFVEQAAHAVAVVSSKLVVSVSDFDASSDLTRGRLVTGARLGWTCFTLIGLRTLPLAALGIWIFGRRELGLVIRE